jgi:hypothetical protein
MVQQLDDFVPAEGAGNRHRLLCGGPLDSRDGHADMSRRVSWRHHRFEFGPSVPQNERRPPHGEVRTESSVDRPCRAEAAYEVALFDEIMPSVITRDRGMIGRGPTSRYRRQLPPSPDASAFGATERTSRRSS